MKVASLTKTLLAGALSVSLVGFSAPKAHAFPWVIIGVGAAAGVVGYVVGRHQGSQSAAYAMSGPGPYKFRASGEGVCARTFRSYDYRTGLITRNGVKQPCPYLH